MKQFTKKQLEQIYPQRKTTQEITERRSAMLERVRVRYVPARIAAMVAFFVALLLAIYSLGNSLAAQGMTSVGSILTLVSLMALMGGGVVWVGYMMYRRIIEMIDVIVPSRVVIQWVLLFAVFGPIHITVMYVEMTFWNLCLVVAAIFFVTLGLMTMLLRRRN